MMSIVSIKVESNLIWPFLSRSYCTADQRDESSYFIDVCNNSKRYVPRCRWQHKISIRCYFASINNRFVCLGCTVKGKTCFSYIAHNNLTDLKG